MASNEDGAPFSDIRITKRNAGGWLGVHGLAFTVTARCPDGKRRTIKRQGIEDRVLLSSGQWRQWMPRQEFSALFMIAQKAAESSSNGDSK